MGACFEKLKKLDVLLKPVDKNEKNEIKNSRKIGGLKPRLFLNTLENVSLFFLSFFLNQLWKRLLLKFVQVKCLFLK